MIQRYIAAISMLKDAFDMTTISRKHWQNQLVADITTLNARHYFYSYVRPTTLTSSTHSSYKDQK
jgi:hypothetical protein